MLHSCTHNLKNSTFLQRDRPHLNMTTVREMKDIWTSKILLPRWYQTDNSATY